MSITCCPRCQYDLLDCDIDDQSRLVSHLHQQIEVQGRDIFEVTGELFREHGLIWREDAHKRQTIERNMQNIWSNKSGLHKDCPAWEPEL